MPHLYGWKWYPWARAFYECRNKIALLCAANQVSKSTTQIRKAINWSTKDKIWSALWPARRPSQFWYFYPTQDTADVEYHEKWVPELLPRGEFRTHPVYGWHRNLDGGKIHSIDFNSGVSIYFKFYSQAVRNIQSGTVDAIFGDEEMPMEFYDECMARLMATDGYFNMVFTATLNQEFWYRVMEGHDSNELLPEAWKLQVSLYDCMAYEDQTPTIWTPERIKAIEQRCKSPEEILRRVHGRFITEVGRKYPAFTPSKHYCARFPIPHNWLVYAANDIGSGGEHGHPAAILFLAVSPDYKKGVFFRGWRGDGVITTSEDILQKFRTLRGPMVCTAQIYDQGAKDFATIASRIGESFIHAEKNHEIGEDILNTLFRNDMLHIFDDDDELRKLGSELLSLSKATAKKNAKDDLSDCARYTVTAVPWDFSSLPGVVSTALSEAAKESIPLTDAEYAAWDLEQRRGIYKKMSTKPEDAWSPINEEISFWNSEAGYDGD